MISNREVVERWGKHKVAASRSMSTNGWTLYSYKLPIGEWRDGLPVVFNYTNHDDRNPFGHRVPPLGSVTPTTNKHIAVARTVGYSFQK